MYSRFKFILFGSVLGLVGWADEPAPARPWETSAVDLESGVLWEIGSLTPIAYRLVPVQLSWRSRALLGHVFDDGSRIVVRHRLTLIGTWVQNGPENRYIGMSGSPSIEWWDKTGAWAGYFGSGGGLGLIDSRGVTGGQGQDFTFNWFIRGGLEHVTPKGRRWTAGIMYQHLSNGGQTDPNPGIDALGFTLGYGWAF
jgi:lipid A 3-O-deacylase